ncbi:uncharacterized protein C19orf47 homolog isoform X1 [Neodiprion fabricii]|uniref:uncharacterized protein C19orf47 homolog isoform X1 n=1 Tax=Neodiprion fabricii TaxID=2872261 RepID=UPI001ED95631|nr:uncharacterized protein C19orf47 homolog isoform X1 [Neodiprion fabricii]
MTLQILPSLSSLHKEHQRHLCSGSYLFTSSSCPCVVCMHPRPLGAIYKMAVSLSAYWVKFFIGAGFPQDVATKHAVVFSNNRIHPDMLPELDKPSLKEMGITLMGDMIAILRYAKKVVEETTCEKFLVDSEGSIVSKITAKPVLKKPAIKMVTRSATPGKVKTEPENTTKVMKNTANAATTSSDMAKKKPVAAKVVSRVIERPKSQVSLKRKLDSCSDDYESEASDEDWDNNNPKKIAPEDEVGYKVIMPKGTTLRSRKILKKVLEQKRTVFDRLGDSSVTSTTNLAETATPTFNVTGLGKEVFKRNSSVFNRLGDKDGKKEQLPYVGILKNGTSSTATPGILKNSSTRLGNTILTTTKVVKMASKPTGGTMRADQEKKQKIVLGKAKQLVRVNKKITINNPSPTTTKVIRKLATSSKLASQQASALPAKARLGVTKLSPVKQVTFNKTATVKRLVKPGVFSRLGV